MPKPFQGHINLDVRDSTPDWDAFLADKPPQGTPNVPHVDVERHMAAAIARD
jgi:hypothetical protein